MHSQEKCIWVNMNLSRDPMASRDAYQKLCGLIADPGSSPTPARPAVANVVKNSHTDGLGQKIKKSQQQASNKLDNRSGMI